VTSESTKAGTTVEQDNEPPSAYDKAHLWMISLMHDTFLGLFVDPYRRLTAAGLEPGQVVLEVGCGPGFYTVPAAGIIGKEGHLYSLDINPAAVERVKRKVKEKGVTNVEVVHADAVRTGLPNASVDTIFLFGVLHSLNDFDAVLLEAHRILKNGGVLAAESSWSESRLLKRFTKDGLFRFAGKDEGIYRFGKESKPYNHGESHETDYNRNTLSGQEVKQ